MHRLVATEYLIPIEVKIFKCSFQSPHKCTFPRNFFRLFSARDVDKFEILIIIFA